MASLAAVFPLADAPAYAASKAGIAAYCESLRALATRSGIDISIIFPGHIATRQTEAHDGPLPLLMSPEDAARRIVASLDRRRPRIWLPRRLAFLARLSSYLPLRWRALAEKSQRFSVRGHVRAR